MRTKSLLAVLGVTLSGCAWFMKPAPEHDLSIRFPSFHERSAVLVGAQARIYELDGLSLRAISIAANDFSPPGGGARECADKQESQRYRVIRREDIFFIQISLDSAACGYGVLDGGARYAIHADGRILRRLFDGEPDTQAADVQGIQAPSEQGTLVPSSQVGATTAGTAPDLPAAWFQKASPDAGSPPPEGGPPRPEQ
jgi:hypothetical protein